ncbi:MAG: hypothetical protein WCJ64_26020 [Rhodospirillaceae bacterium]
MHSIDGKRQLPIGVLNQPVEARGSADAAKNRSFKATKTKNTVLQAASPDAGPAQAGNGWGIV